MSLAAVFVVAAGTVSPAGVADSTLTIVLSSNNLHIILHSNLTSLSNLQSIHHIGTRELDLQQRGRQ